MLTSFFINIVNFSGIRENDILLPGIRDVLIFGSGIRDDDPSSPPSSLYLLIYKDVHAYQSVLWAHTRISAISLHSAV